MHAEPVGLEPASRRGVEKSVRELVVLRPNTLPDIGGNAHFSRRGPASTFGGCTCAAVDGLLSGGGIVVLVAKRVGIIARGAGGAWGVARTADAERRSLNRRGGHDVGYELLGAAAARHIFPFGFRWQPFTDPLRVRSCVIPAHAHDRVILATFNG